MMLSAALTGTVDFSTTILLLFAVSAIFRAQDSMYFRSAARPYNRTGVELKVKMKQLDVDVSPPAFIWP